MSPDRCIDINEFEPITSLRYRTAKCLVRLCPSKAE